MEPLCGKYSDWCRHCGDRAVHVLVRGGGEKGVHQYNDDKAKFDRRMRMEEHRAERAEGGAAVWNERG